MKNIFPTTGDTSFFFLNLDEEVKRAGVEIFDQEQANNFVRGLQRKKGLTYGGYMQDRSHIFKHTRLAESRKFMQIGISYDVPAGTPVGMPAQGRLVHAYDDQNQNYGWGGRLSFLMPRGLIYIIGRLQQPVIKDLGRTFEAGQLIGVNGNMSENGGWYEHSFHQIVDQYFLDRHGWQDVDGFTTYHSKDLENISDPEIFRLAVILGHIK